MKLIPILLLFISGRCLAHTDTSLVYLNKANTTTVKDSAFSVLKIYRENDAWHGREYYLKNDVLKSEGNFESNSIDRRIGSFKNFTDSGQLDFVVSYENYQPAEFTYYYKDGSKKSWLQLSGTNIKAQTGWDESGKEIKGFIVKRDPQFKGGINGWLRYLEKNLNGMAPINAGMASGRYTAYITFNISKNGKISEIKAWSSSCKSCEEAAINVVSRSRDWQPAIFQNEPVDYFGHKLGITFIVP